MAEDRPVIADMPSVECHHILRLMFACVEDFMLDLRAYGRTVDSIDLPELCRLGLVLGLSVKRFFGVNWLGVSTLVLLALT